MTANKNKTYTSTLLKTSKLTYTEHKDIFDTEKSINNSNQRIEINKVPEAYSSQSIKEFKLQKNQTKK